MTGQATPAIRHYTVAEIAGRYDELGIPGKWPPEESRLIVGVLDAIAEGRPVEPAAVAEIAARADIDSSAADALLRGITERDSADRIIGLMGLTQNADFDIRFTVDRKELRTWCALDTLFLPLLLDRVAVVSAESSLRGEPVRFTVGPDGVSGLSPQETTVSLVIPSTSARRGIKKVEDMWLAFCHQVRFSDHRKRRLNGPGTSRTSSSHACRWRIRSTSQPGHGATFSSTR